MQRPAHSPWGCVCVSAGLALQVGGTRSSFVFSNMGMASVGWGTVPSAGASPRTSRSPVLSPAKDQPGTLFPRVWGERGGSGGSGEALGCRAVSSALAARKYWSLGLPVALQYCIAALVRLEIGPCRRSQGSGSRGAPSAPHSTFHPPALGSRLPHQ